MFHSIFTSFDSASYLKDVSSSLMTYSYKWFLVHDKYPSIKTLVLKELLLVNLD